MARMLLRSALPLAAALLLAPAASSAQEVRLGEASVTFPEDFGSIQTVRELPDGRVLVADPLGGDLYVVDMARGTRRVVGAKGQGPDEYRQPDAVWPLPGDSTLLVDLGNGRLAILDPALGIRRTFPIAQGDGGPPSPGRALTLALPQAVDGGGNLYFREMATMGRGGPQDSASVLRMHVGGGEAGRVVSFKLQEMAVSRSGSGNNQNVSIRPVPLSPEDAWGVAADGSVVVARAGDYHVEWVRPDGRVVRGPAVAYRPVRIRQAEKDEWVAEQGRTGGGIGVGMTMENGVRSMTFSRGGMGGARATDQYQWPEVKPPFYGGRIPVDGLGRAWVRRHVGAGEPSTYDVFDGEGRRVATVLLDPGKRVVGFGKDAMYVVAYDEFDLNHLQRYALPSL